MSETCRVVQCHSRQ